MFKKIKSIMFFKKKTDPGIEQLKRHEGLRLKMYRCTTGANSIGIGHNLETRVRVPMAKTDGWLGPCDPTTS